MSLSLERELGFQNRTCFVRLCKLLAWTSQRPLVSVLDKLLTILNWPPTVCFIPSLISKFDIVARLVGWWMWRHLHTRHHEGDVPMRYEEGSLNKETRQAFRTISRLMELFDTINDEDRLLAHRTLWMKWRLEGEGYVVTWTALSRGRNKWLAINMITLPVTCGVMGFESA